MMRRTRDLPARRRGELKRSLESQRLSSAIDAQRSLTARRADGNRTKARPVGLSDPRYAYLTRAVRNLALGGRLRTDMSRFERRG
jgi:hypothetical protein